MDVLRESITVFCMLSFLTSIPVRSPDRVLWMASTASRATLCSNRINSSSMNISSTWSFSRVLVVKDFVSLEKKEVSESSFACGSVIAVAL